MKIDVWFIVSAIFFYVALVSAAVGFFTLHEYFVISHDKSDLKYGLIEICAAIIAVLLIAIIDARP